MVGADIAREIDRLFPGGGFVDFVVISASKTDRFLRQHEQQEPIVSLLCSWWEGEVRNE